MPLISIGMPVYNCEQTVAMAIRSIIQQTYPNWELLVLDDGSQDNTLQTVMSIQDSRIRVFSDSDNRGQSVRLNQAIDESKGEYFA
ncbi:MAG TPA: glycosyltransferase, partial [Negativicutes bacterium]|nr:glycosyltransferase [Negativicutes bacterium]